VDLAEILVQLWRRRRAVVAVIVFAAFVALAMTYRFSVSPLGLAHRSVESGTAETQILVVGASYTPGTPDPTIDWINEAIGAAAHQLGLPFVDPAEENWTDPDDPAIWADPNHPNDAGYQRIADRLAPLLESLLDR